MRSFLLLLCLLLAYILFVTSLGYDITLRIQDVQYDLSGHLVTLSIIVCILCVASIIAIFNYITNIKWKKRNLQLIKKRLDDFYFLKDMYTLIFKGDAKKLREQIHLFIARYDASYQESQEVLRMIEVIHHDHIASSKEDLVSKYDFLIDHSSKDMKKIYFQKRFVYFVENKEWSSIRSLVNIQSFKNYVRYIDNEESCKYIVYAYALHNEFENAIEFAHKAYKHKCVGRDFYKKTHIMMNHARAFLFFENSNECHACLDILDIVNPYIKDIHGNKDMSFIHYFLKIFFIYSSSHNTDIVIRNIFKDAIYYSQHPCFYWLSKQYGQEKYPEEVSNWPVSIKKEYIIDSIKTLNKDDFISTRSVMMGYFHLFERLLSIDGCWTSRSIVLFNHFISHCNEEFSSLKLPEFTPLVTADGSGFLQEYPWDIMPLHVLHSTFFYNSFWADAFLKYINASHDDTLFYNFKNFSHVRKSKKELSLSDSRDIITI